MSKSLPAATEKNFASMTTDPNRPELAREYLRVSLDRSGRERSTTEQMEDNRRRWAEWTFAEPYSDISISASRYSTKVRGGYGELIADLEADRFGAGVLVLWESSRGSRKVGEWVELIDLCEAKAVKIAVTQHERVYDALNARDRRSLLEDAVDSEYESGKMSARLKRSQAARAAEGAPHGRVPYGYKRTYDPENGKLQAQVIEPSEASVVKELFDRLCKGHSLRSIAQDFDRRGVRTRSGKTFTAQHLRSLAKGHRYVGDRVWEPGSRGHNGSGYRKGPVTITKGQWPAIVDRSTWLAVQRILDAPERRTTRPGRAIHLLSMIAKCDICGGPVASTARSGRKQYQCHHKGCIRIDEAELDALAEAVVVAYLRRPDNVRRLTRDEGTEAELQAVKEELAGIRAELDDLADLVGRGELSATLAARAEPAISRRLEVAERRRDELTTPGALRALVSPGKDVQRRWAAAPMSAKREVLRLLLVPEVLGELRVTRSPSPGHKVPAGERVKWTK